MEPDKHLNMTKVLIAVAIFVFAFLIIFASAMITRKARSSGNDKKMLLSEPKNVTTNDDEDKNQTDDENSGEFEEFLSHLQNNIDEEDNSSENNFNSSDDNSQTTNMRVPIPNPDAVALCKQAQTGDEKNIYLTFDDGPSPNITPQILKTLKKYDVPATFFVLGSRVELYPELVKQEYEEGHFIANHGYSHKYSSIYSSVQSVIDEFNATEIAVQNALGNPNYHTLLFRFPGGSSGGPYDDLKASAKSTLEQMGVPSTNWNCLTGDAEGDGKSTKEQLLNRLYETASGWTSLVVLMHDANDKQATADALPAIIEHYRNEGYTFKNYYDIFQ